MIATGIIRRIDDLGRIVIPKEIRRQLKVNESDPFEIFMTKEGEVILKPYKQQEYTLRRDDCWEELIAPNGKVICGNHKLDATEILNALGIQYNEEEEQSSSFCLTARALSIRAAILYPIALEFVKRKKQICAICTVFLKLFVQNDDIKKNVKILLLKLSCSGIMYT